VEDSNNNNNVRAEEEVLQVLEDSVGDSVGDALRKGVLAKSVIILDRVEEVVGGLLTAAVHVVVHVGDVGDVVEEEELEEEEVSRLIILTRKCRITFQRTPQGKRKCSTMILMTTFQRILRGSRTSLTLTWMITSNRRINLHLFKQERNEEEKTGGKKKKKRTTTM
jgi:hypothetical protein